jgi:hypothetical protein
MTKNAKKWKRTFGCNRKSTRRLKKSKTERMIRVLPKTIKTSPNLPRRQQDPN